MDKETKDTWIFRGMMSIVFIITLLAVISWGIVSIIRFIKRIFNWKGK